MDEIIIEDKKYISSKQASKITGYAKDYVGQLCREGRVPARLVGRSWYVLDSAIQDHRFGNQEVNTEDVAPKSTEEPVEQTEPAQIERDWGSFHYEVQTEEVVPTVNQLQERNPLGVIGSDEGSKKETVATEVAQSLQEAWGEWFSGTKNASRAIETPETSDIVVAEPVVYIEGVEDVQMEAEGESVDIPLTIVNYQQVPKQEVLPVLKKHEKDQVVPPRPREGKRRGGISRTVRWIQGGASVVAVVFVALAVFGSGYMDKYLSSFSALQVLSGTIVYEK